MALTLTYGGDETTAILEPVLGRAITGGWYVELWTDVLDPDGDGFHAGVPAFFEATPEGRAVRLAPYDTEAGATGSPFGKGATTVLLSQVTDIDIP